jgi:hypothetical protein
MWHVEAQKIEIENFVKQIQAVRIGFMGGEEYSNIIHELQLRARVLEVGSEKVIRQNWEDVRSMISARKKNNV